MLIVRYTAAQKLGTTDFEPSQFRYWPFFSKCNDGLGIDGLYEHEPNTQSYLFFWNKLDKCNYYLELSIELAEEPLDSRIVWDLAQECRSSDGQYEMVRFSYLNTDI